MKIKTAIIILLLFHISGIIAVLATPYKNLFLSLTPLNLLISSCLLFIFHTFLTKKQVIIFAIIALLGFFVEVIGVFTGVIFGNYFYGDVLGWKILNTPLIIGVNWIMLTYSATYSWFYISKNSWFIAFLSASTLVLLDFLIEPVAVAYNFWQWTDSKIPTQNYFAWFFISFMFCFLLAKFKHKSTNLFAPYLLGTQFFFFLVLFIFR